MNEKKGAVINGMGGMATGGKGGTGPGAKGGAGGRIEIGVSIVPGKGGDAGNGGTKGKDGYIVIPAQENI